MAHNATSNARQARLAKALQHQKGMTIKGFQKDTKADKSLLEEFCNSKTLSHQYFPKEDITYTDDTILGTGGYGTVRMAKLNVRKTMKTSGGEYTEVEALYVACKEIREVAIKDGDIDPYRVSEFVVLNAHFTTSVAFRDLFENYTSGQNSSMKTSCRFLASRLPNIRITLH